MDSFEYFKSLVVLLIRSSLCENLALYFFLGMCTFLAISKSVLASVGLGLSVMFVQTITVPINNLIYTYFLHSDLKVFGVIFYIVTIALSVQMLEIILDRFFPSLYQALGIFLPLITVNCAILGASLFMVEKDLNFSQSVVYGFGSGLGWAGSIIILAGIRERLKYSDVPQKLKDTGITFIIAGILALTFMASSGL